MKYRKPPTHTRCLLFSLIFLVGALFLMNFVISFVFADDSDSLGSWVKSSLMSNLALLISFLVLLKSLQCKRESDCR